MTTTNSLILRDRRIFRVSGPDAREFLRGIVTQSLSGLTGDTALYSLLLTPQGKIIADFFLTLEGEDILLETDAAIADALLKKLTLYKLRANVSIEDETGQWAVGVVWDDLGGQPGNMLSHGPLGMIAYNDPRAEGMGIRLLGNPSRMAGILEELCTQEGDEESYDRHRLSLGIPVFGKDFDTEQVFPMDANMDRLHAIDYKKGCFVGQEVASRMKRKGEVRKRMVKVESDSALEAGETITAGETTLGEISSAQGQSGMALVRLDRIEKAGGMDAGFEADGMPVRLTLPFYLHEMA